MAIERCDDGGELNLEFKNSMNRTEALRVFQAIEEALQSKLAKGHKLSKMTVLLKTHEEIWTGGNPETDSDFDYIDETSIKPNEQKKKMLKRIRVKYVSDFTLKVTTIAI